MKSVKLAVLFGVLSLIFMGCPYESPYPVDNVSNAIIDKTLKGSWEDRSDDKHEYKYIITLDGNMYNISKRGSDTTNYVGFISKVGDGKYLNLYEVSKYDDAETVHKYYIYKLKMMDGRCQIKGLTDNITEEFSSSQELRDFIIKYQGLSFFFDKDESKEFLKDL